MANPTITTCDTGSVALEGCKYREDDLLYFSGATTYAAGTILGRKLISDTIAVAYTRAGTSTYTVAASCHASVTLELGAYVVTAGTLTSGHGAWTAVSPVTGKSETVTTSADTDHLVFTKLGLTLTVTAGGGTTWDTGDVITATAAAQSGLPLVALDVDGKGGAQVPVAVMPTAYTSTGSGNVAYQAIVAGEVNRDRLSTVDSDTITDAILDQLKANGIVATKQTQMSVLDNGAS